VSPIPRCAEFLQQTTKATPAKFLASAMCDSVEFLRQLVDSAAIDEFHSLHVSRQENTAKNFQKYIEQYSKTAAPLYELSFF
jgi:hypothetical protein